MQYSLHNINAQVASGGKVPMKPGGCNHSHIPKALEHLTGPCARPPTGNRHTQGKWLSEKKYIYIYIYISD